MKRGLFEQKYDLSKANFPERKKSGLRRSSADLVDIAVSIIDSTHGRKNKTTKEVAFSIRKSILDTIGSERLSAAVIDDRLYIVPHENGYKLSFNSNAKNRGYLRFPTDNLKDYMRFIGDHDLHYDKYNAAYYAEL